MVKKAVRRIQIKVWPELTGYVPAIIPYERIPVTKKNALDFDFSNVSSIEIASLNLILIKLIKATMAQETLDWDIIFSKDKAINRQLKESGFLDIFPVLVPNSNLFWQHEVLHKRLEQSDNKNLTFDIIPLFHLNFSKYKDRRIVIDEFKEWLIQNLSFLRDMHGFKIHKLILILLEIAKNSGDHTKGDAFFGIDIIKLNGAIKLQFSLGDLGIGITRTIRQVVKKLEEYKQKHKHFAVTDAYHLAFKIGFSGKPNSKLNRGIGMSTIFNLSRQIGLDLSVYDAESRGILTSAEDTTHTELRKVFYTIGFSAGFYYYGTLKIIL